MELKEFLVNENLSQSCYTDEDQSKGIIVNKTLLQTCSTDKDQSKGIIVDECSTEDDESELKGIGVNKCSTEEDKSSYNIYKNKDAKNEVTYDVPGYFNIL